MGFHNDTRPFNLSLCWRDGDSLGAADALCLALFHVVHRLHRGQPDPIGVHWLVSRRDGVQDVRHQSWLCPALNS